MIPKRKQWPNEQAKQVPIHKCVKQVVVKEPAFTQEFRDWLSYEEGNSKHQN